MPIDRSLGRNVQFYHAASPEVALEGMIQNGSVTEGDFLNMLGILLITETPIRVQEKEAPPWMYRIMSHNVSGRNAAFMTGIHARDGSCVISGVAAHIFPLEMEDPVSIRYGMGYCFVRIFTLCFEQYLISVNPDVTDRTITKLPCLMMITLDWTEECLIQYVEIRNDWHRVFAVAFFRQSVFAIMRGVGEPIFEMTFQGGI
ncbi:hypothetical protein L211DRAFT_858049 [Terfezia boudieri ATCC MYA-4762]|uniref:DUF7881 domain-containing protein n=1 Tax=Terfezia boudieri ATCC MYA-4762 TaxID=1051890 RepID=A0A3N4LLD0_9PEZI|nr:hypothetical protein L211DRAFT_858049 [Terfezia boudieri ATCC MYA-4762]